MTSTVGGPSPSPGCTRQKPVSVASGLPSLRPSRGSLIHQVWDV